VTRNSSVPPGATWVGVPARPLVPKTGKASQPPRPAREDEP